VNEAGADEAGAVAGSEVSQKVEAAIGVEEAAEGIEEIAVVVVVFEAIVEEEEEAFVETAVVVVVVVEEDLANRIMESSTRMSFRVLRSFIANKHQTLADHWYEIPVSRRLATSSSPR
jgi:hypothetical protein